MPSNTPFEPPLRGHVPFGELTPFRDHYWTEMAEIPMYEGTYLPLMRVLGIVGSAGVWVVPSILGGGPSWTWNPNAGGVGHPKSGHNAIQIYAEDSIIKPGGQGLVYSNIWDPTWASFLGGRNYSFLIVGTPMLFSDPSYGGATDTFRMLFNMRLPNNNVRNLVQLNYATGVVRWQQFLATGYVTLPRLFRNRMAMLFVHGDEQEQSGIKPRLYVADSGGTERYQFTTGTLTGTYPLGGVSGLELFENQSVLIEGYCAGGCWEYFAIFLRNFEDGEARTLCRDVFALTKWDAHVPNRVGRLPVAQLSAEPMGYGRVSARPLGSRRVVAVPASYDRVSATPRSTGPRVAADPTGYERISARVRIADKEADVQATPLCPAELNFDADNVLELADVMDEMQDPPAEITSATLVTCEIWDRETDTELTAVSPVTLNQVGATNHWRNSVLVNAANGFAINQRLMLVFIFDGGVGLRGRFVALAVVVSATS